MENFFALEAERFYENSESEDDETNLAHEQAI